MSDPRPDRTGHAVVLGAGIAGLLAARVLSDAFAQVTLVERDSSQGPLPRRGAPQGYHLHGLLDRGRQIVEDLHPGLTDELVAAGALVGEPLRETRWYLHGRRLRPTATGMRSVLCTRPLLEHVLRTRTLALPAVDLVHDAASGLSTSGGGVDGVRCGTTRLAADLVVDASGRASRLPTWLAELGFQSPREDRVDIDLGYTSRFVARTPEQLGGDLSAIVSTVPRSRGGGGMAVEQGRWLVTLAGILGDHPPADPAGFDEYAGTLPVPVLDELVRTSAPLSDPVPYRFRGSRWRRFDLLTAVPDGLLVLGDAVCSPNPLYAQGMTLAAQQALVVAGWLRGARDTRSFHAGIGRLCRDAWEIATRADLALPEVPGRRTSTARVLDAYVSRMQRVAATDPVVARGLIRVANLADPATALMTPRLVTRVLRPGADRPGADQHSPAPVNSSPTTVNSLPARDPGPE